MATIPKSVAIIYGWAEGTWQSKLFCRQLQEKGFTITGDVSNADIIFAHSLGCYLVPRDAKAKLVFLVGLPYWPGRNPVSAVYQKLRGELEFHRRDNGLMWWLNKLLHNWGYILIRPKANYDVLTKQRLDNLPDTHNKRVVLLRPSDDTMMHPDVHKLIAREDYEFIELEGAHDDCWIKPELYVDQITHA